MEVRDIMYPRPYTKNGEDKTEWVKLGTLFIKNENGQVKISGILKATPVGGDGNFQAFAPKPKDSNTPQSSYNQPQQAESSLPTYDLDSDIRIEDVPF